MKSYNDIMNEGLSADEVPAAAQQAAAMLQTEISKLVPDYFKVAVYYGENLGRSITVHVIDVRKESIKVTWHNSDNIMHFMMHLSDRFGRNGGVSKVAWERLATHDQRKFPFRKITDSTIEGASKKLIGWFKKNQKVISEAPAEYPNPNFR